MKIAIAYPPILSEKGVALLSQNRQFQWFSQPTYIYPVVPAYAATMLENAGHTVFWMDAICEQLNEADFLTQVGNNRPDLMMIETKTPVVRMTWEWIKTLKHTFPKMVIAIVGDHVTALPEETMQNSPVDYILTGGDYDFLLQNLATHLSTGADLEKGIWYRDKNGEIKNTGHFELNHDLNTLPRINRNLTKWQNYSIHNGNYRRTPGAYIMAGRDCWHGKCTFCSWTTLYPKYRTRTPESVIDEIGDLIENYGVREIMDDTGCFPVGDWLRKFCTLLIERGYNRKIYFDCNMRFGALTEDDYALMKKAGFRFVLFGVESANQATLDRVNKNLKVEAVREGAKAASKAGLDVHITIMIGYPWETKEDISRTVCLAQDLMKRGYAYTLQVTHIIPYPGTPLFGECQKKGLLLTEKWEDYDMRSAVMKTPVPEETLREAIRTVYRSFIHPLSLWNRLIHTRHPLEDAKFYLRGIKSLFGHLRDFK